MLCYVADFEQYCALQGERDSVGKKRVHVNNGDFLARKPSKVSYTEASALLQQVPELQITGCRNMCNELFLDMLFVFFLRQCQEKVLGNPLGWLVLAVCAILRIKQRDSKKVCVTAGGDCCVIGIFFSANFGTESMFCESSYPTQEQNKSWKGETVEDKE